MTQGDDPDLPNMIPPVPRPVTSQARRRSWNELSVRIWVLITAAVTLATAYVTVTRVRQAYDDRWLIEQGVFVNARILWVNGSNTPKRWPRNESMPLVIEFALPGGKTSTYDITLEAKPDAYAMVGTTLPIRVDPNNPQRWTEQEKPEAWIHELVMPIGLMPVVLLLVIITILRRQKVLSTWQNGSLTSGTVVQTHHTAAAPLSRVVGFTLTEDDDQRIWKLLLPVKAGIPEPGGRIWLICPSNNPARAIAAGLYTSGRAPV